jgi:NAD(P)-dependent dehydrogenase (short-subunit alcohol dehydrogenase family)
MESQIRELAEKPFTTIDAMDIIMCNVGIGWTGPTYLMDRSDWDKVLGVNL